MIFLPLSYQDETIIPPLVGEGDPAGVNPVYIILINHTRFNLMVIFHGDPNILPRRINDTWNVAAGDPFMFNILVLKTSGHQQILHEDILTLGHEEKGLFRNTQSIGTLGIFILADNAVHPKTQIPVEKFRFHADAEEVVFEFKKGV